MLSVLLVAINAKYIHSNPAVHSLRAYARAYLTKPVGIGIGEYTINQPVGEILAKIYRYRPDILCFSCYIWNLGYVEELAEEYRKLCPQTPVWVGGPEVSYEAERFLGRHPAVTGIMAGEGEQTFLELCEYYAGAGTAAEPGDIAGTVCRGRDGIRTAAAREPLDMDRLPFCCEGPGDFCNRIIYYESSRGCPFRCSYCLSSVEKHLRFRSAGLVERDLACLLDWRVSQVRFVDRTFNCRPEHALRIWRFIRGHDNGVTSFHFEVAADLLTGEMLGLLEGMRPGLVQLEIGVQSANETTIAEIHRTMNLERVKEAVQRLLASNRIHVHLDLIAGLPYEDYDSFIRSFDEIYALKPDQLQLGFLKVLRGSYMYEHAKEYGLIYKSRPPYEVLATKWLGYGELLRIRRVEEMLEICYNSGQYGISMRLLETQYESPFAMYRGLGDFYEERGYDTMSHSRMRRAEILIEFAEENTEISEILKEGLIFDLYCRENCKSRPGWAADTAEWRELARRICGRNRQLHVERFHYRFPGKEKRTLGELPVRREQPLYVVFDYTRRDPLDHQAFWEYCGE